MDIIKAIQNIKPKLAQSTLNKYASNLRSVHRIVLGDPKYDNLDLLKDHEKVLTALKDTKLRTKKTYLTAMCVAVQTMQPVDNDLLDHYRKALFELHEDLKKMINTGKKTDSQEKNWIEWKEILKIHRKLKQDAQYCSKNIGTRLNFEVYQWYVLLSVYVEHTLRNDFVMRKIKRKDYDKMDEEERERQNWVIIEPRRQKSFQLNQFKTRKNYDKSPNFKISKNLNSVLNKWFKINKTEHLFVKAKDRTTPIDDGWITSQLVRLFERYAGKKVSTGILRHSRITHLRKGERTKQQEQEMAYQFLHSAGMSKEYMKV